MTSSPKSSDSGRLSIFESYICKEPAGEIALLMRNGPDEFSGLLRTLQRSAEYFTERNQPRIVERIHYEQAMLHLQHEHWQHALRILLPLWQTLSWRKAGWWLLLAEVDRALQICATQTQDADTLIAVQWELLNSSLTPHQEGKFANAIDDLNPRKMRPRPQIRCENVLCPVSARLAFVPAQAHVGVPLNYQLVIQSVVSSQVSDVRLHGIDVLFEGPLKNLKLIQKDKAASAQSPSASNIRLEQVSLQDGASTSSDATSLSSLSSGADYLVGEVDLTLAPASVIVLCLSDIPREAEDLEVAKITLAINEPKFDLEVTSTEDNDLHQDRIFIQSRRGAVDRAASNERSHSIKVLPKPPRVHLGLPSTSSASFTDQRSLIEMVIENKEDEEISVQLSLEFVDQSHDAPTIAWAQDNMTGDNNTEHSSQELVRSQTLRFSMLPSSAQAHSIDIAAGPSPSEQTLRINALYFMKSQPDTPHNVSIKHDILVQKPFEVAFNFSPLLHSEAWPDYFDIPDLHTEVTRTPHGLIQKWSLFAKILPLTKSNIVLKSVTLDVKVVQEDAECRAHSPGTGEPEEEVAAGEIGERCFQIDVQKYELEDRQLTYVDAHLNVVWQLSNNRDLPEIISHVPVPELAVTFGEPRVLASLGASLDLPGTVHVDYTIENPSTFPLTFSVMLETSDEFAFSGPKNISLHLLPLSRQTIGYGLLPLVRGTWIHPQLRVYDQFFHKTLRVQGANGIRHDKKGIGIWIDVDG